jgi:cysteine-rich repeat protein
MNFRSLLGTAIAATALFVGSIGSQGCTATTAATGGTHCTPGNYVFCRCADRSEGTKLCKDDGVTFEACSTGTAGVCQGGEVTDPNTGTEVTPPPESQQQPPQQAGPPGSPVDTCPGKPTAVSAGPDLVIDGDTTGATGDLKGKTGACSAGDGGPDHVYHLQPTGSGALTIKVKGEGAMNPLIYLRSTCADEATQTACAPPLGAAGLVQIQANVVAGHDYFLVVDGASGSAGKYKLTTKLTTGSFCGDGKIDADEACDDGNKTDGDGCANNCKGISGNPAAADCTNGHVVHLWKGATVTGTGSTLTYGNTFSKTGTACDVSTSNLNLAPDHVYEVTAHAAGNLKVTLTPTEPTFNMEIVARRSCTDPASQGAGMCANSGSAGAIEAATFPVANGEKVYVAAEGALNAKGTYTIKFELP